MLLDELSVHDPVALTNFAPRCSRTVMNVLLASLDFFHDLLSGAHHSRPRRPIQAKEFVDALGCGCSWKIITPRDHDRLPHGHLEALAL